jgi:nicotinamidase-related amidase
MTSDHPLRSPDLLSAAESLLLLVDVQERLIPHVSGGETVTANCNRLARAAGLFGVPVTVTEQYPKGLGPTVPELASLFAGADAIPANKAEKLRFSAAEATGWPPAGEREDGRHQVVLAGVETHVCVLQTAFDLLSQGYRVSVVADAAGSRRDLDRDAALARLRDGGATVTTTESVLFEWCEAAGTDQFKKVRELVVER